MQIRLPLIGLFAVACSFVGAQDVNVTEVKAAFDAAKIPTTFNVVFNPTALLQVSFPQQNGASPVILKAGNKVQRSATAGPPQYKVSGTNSTGPFVIVMVDPDAPTPGSPNWSPIRHYLGGGWTASSTGVLTTTTNAVTAFFQPSPSGTEAHRYTFLLFNQSPGFATQKLVNSQTSITNWNLSNFAQQVGLGSPIAGTFMLVSAQ